ncbi:hypothetical protein [Actinoplanes sp. NPDC049265]|uniref:hypothetical protein n=1 Tax=Actinoplanes sp. NPDC049265 TaxID=3363902 RepID=UPI00372282AC
MQVEIIGSQGVLVRRPGKSDAVGYCAEPSARNDFDIEELESAVKNIPRLGMIIITRRAVAPDVYDRASELGVCVDTFGGFVRAIASFDDVSQYVHPDESYVRKRLLSTRIVSRLNRRGHRAWEIERQKGLRSLTIVTHERYELTDDDFTTLLNQHLKIDIDALVITNTNARGFGERVTRNARQVGIPIFTLDQFIGEIRAPWT